MKQVLKLALLLTSACAFSNSSFASNELQEQISGVTGKAGSVLPSVAPQSVIQDIENSIAQLKNVKSLAKTQVKNNKNNSKNNSQEDSLSSIVKVIPGIVNGLNKVNGSINSNEQLKASVGNIGIGASSKTSVHAKGMMGLPVDPSELITLANLAGTLSGLVNNGQLIGDVQTVLSTAKTGLDLLNTLKNTLSGNAAKLPAVPANDLPVKKRDL